MKRERDSQTEYKNSFTNNTKNTDDINNKRNNKKYTKPILDFPELDATGTDLPPAAARQHQEVPDGLSSRQVLDSEMHGLESGSGSQAG